MESSFPEAPAVIRLSLCGCLVVLPGCLTCFGGAGLNDL